MTGRRTNDDCIYTAEAVRVGLILFPPRTCGRCHAVLPANTDYFAKDKRSHGDLPLTYQCRRCRRELARASMRRRRKGEP